MSDHGEMIIVGVGLDLVHLRDGKSDIGNAALDLRQASNIGLAGLGDHRRIGRQVVLDAQNHVAVRREHVVDEGIFGALDGIAVAEDHDRQLDHAGVGLHLLVPPNSNVHRDRPVIAIRIVESETLVANSPFADAEITDGDQRTDRKKNRNSTLHVRHRLRDVTGANPRTAVAK